MTSAESEPGEAPATPVAPLSERANRWMRHLSGALLGVCAVGALWACYGAVASHVRNSELLAALGLWLVMSVAAVAIHEFGHYLGARMTGMTVLAVAVGAVEAVPVVGGWRLQSRSPHATSGEAGGYVIACPDPERRSRADTAILLLAGPLSNLCVAVVLAVAMLSLPSSPWQSACFAFALLNFAGFACNLLPYRTRTLFTDGLQLLYLRQPRSEMEPIAVAWRLVARSYRGDTAEELPEDELRVLSDHADQLPLSYEWYRLKASQNLGQWQHVTEWESAVNRQVAQVSDAALAQLSRAFLPLLRAEIAFSRSMASGDAGYVEAVGLARDVQREAPHLMPRLRALAAGLRGDAARAARELELSRQAAETSIQVALRRSEARLRAYVQATISADPDAH
ncbi:M50 family metallopeptidase [Lysobacter sp. 5GHs7-4]|uniref:M50 family metallopeptidase n=1 Tax=Lysobacter sp. 5GHs7-4 TaxID=2904253 RepID=UPI001E2D092B|nr:M50 family metallopeptidase [Lysobacter sp. 5GHs7-4]UHQ21733.1 M50 family metallopeptidase [Lysobacter sp. 5GHs7-4]